MKIGFRFTDNGLELTVLRFAGNDKNNLALLICHDDGLFVTVRDLSRDADGSYSWSWDTYEIYKH